MTVLLTVLFAVLFFVLIMVSIALHEVGHLVPAKLFGVKVTQYFVGFGKTLWSVRRGETEYGVKAFPLGGYVRLVGMYPPKRPGAKQTWLTRVADQARSFEWDSIRPEDDGSLFYQKKTWQKVIVMLSGPAMNVLLAFLIFLGINVFHGTYQPTLTVGQMWQCVVSAEREDRTCTADDPPTPAVEAGVQVGDTLVSFNGVALTGWDQMGDLVRTNRDGPATVVVERDGAEVTLPTVNTVLNHVPDRLDPTKFVEAGFFGVSPTQELTKAGPLTTAAQMWDMTKQSTVALMSFPARIWNVAADLVTGQPRDVNSPISILGASRVAGEITTTDQLGTADKVASYLSLLGAVNLFVALLNLVPLLPLDGGHVAGALWEWLRRQFARLGGRPDPGPVDTAKGLPVTYAVGAFLLLGGLVLIAADLISPIRLF
ncbi:site-2 protease family protein [Tessaracoccus sp. MC1865]|uniref:M50 family metallopeptidase n=1 Tax=Tessaracoccus sp. MC1865 TaxID=2760310 RepID=UPI001601C61B|nr:site-2 protease family protein [Tessaracoccus sp. MC1865]MBB1484860.1 site-2 protease family protein [Tessaracoccus sp. MC1865]QTO38738.1 site-2 protease family protein [Tessaracoccus sp. MC1865]